jgi:hypothetical protein
MAHSFGQDYQIIVVGGGIAGLATGRSPRVREAMLPDQLEAWIAQRATAPQCLSPDEIAALQRLRTRGPPADAAQSLKARTGEADRQQRPIARFRLTR